MSKESLTKTGKVLILSNELIALIEDYTSGRNRSALSKKFYDLMVKGPSGKMTNAEVKIEINRLAKELIKEKAVTALRTTPTKSIPQKPVPSNKPATKKVKRKARPIQEGMKTFSVQVTIQQTSHSLTEHEYSHAEFLAMVTKNISYFSLPAPVDSKKDLSRFILYFHVGARTPFEAGSFISTVIDKYTKVGFKTNHSVEVKEIKE